MMDKSDGAAAQPAVVRIQRFNPDVDKKPYLHEYHIPVMPDTTILDALELIKMRQDGSLTFLRSCRHGICGSCAMNVNGHNTLICNQPIRAHLNKKSQVTIRPLPFLPIIKDLVVDRTQFWEQYLKVKPWLLPPAGTPEKEYRVTPDEVAALHNAEKCIMCGACYSACQVVTMNKNYLGPHAMLKAFVRVMDPRDSQPSQRLKDLDGDYGVFRCHTIFNCIDACPKNLNPTEAIETLRKLIQKRESFAAARRQRQEELLSESG